MNAEPAPSAGVADDLGERCGTNPRENMPLCATFREQRNGHKSLVIVSLSSSEYGKKHVAQKPNCATFLARPFGHPGNGGRGEIFPSRLELIDRLKAKHGSSSDFGGLFGAEESPDCVLLRVVSRKALWRETPSSTAILCHSFYGLASASKGCKLEARHGLRLQTAQLAQNGRQPQNCHSVCHQLRHTTASAEPGHFDDRLTPQHQCVAAN